jgi:hypothetical protein
MVVINESANQRCGCSLTRLFAGYQVILKRPGRTDKAQSFWD